MIDFVTGIIKSMNLSPGRTQALLGAVLGVGGGVRVHGQVFNGGDQAPHVSILNSLQLPPGTVLSTTAPVSDTPRRSPDPPSPMPAPPAVPLDRVRTVAKGRSFALSGRGAFAFPPFLPMPWQPAHGDPRHQDRPEVPVG